jgi:hypothetical protein
MRGGFNAKQMRVAIDLAQSTGQEFIYLVPKGSTNSAGGEARAVYRLHVSNEISYGTSGQFRTINLANINACKLENPLRLEDGNYSGTERDCGKPLIKNFDIEVPGIQYATIIVNENPTNEDIGATLEGQKAQLLGEGVSQDEVDQVTPIMALTLAGDIDIIPDDEVDADAAFYEILRNNCPTVNGNMTPSLFKRKLQLCFHPDKNRNDDASAIFKKITDIVPDELMQGYLNGTFVVPRAAIAGEESDEDDEEHLAITNGEEDEQEQPYENAGEQPYENEAQLPAAEASKLSKIKEIIAYVVEGTPGVLYAVYAGSKDLAVDAKDITKNLAVGAKNLAVGAKDLAVGAKDLAVGAKDRVKDIAVGAKNLAVGAIEYKQAVTQNVMSGINTILEKTSPTARVYGKMHDAVASAVDGAVTAAAEGFSFLTTNDLNQVSEKHAKIVMSSVLVHAVGTVLQGFWQSGGRERTRRRRANKNRDTKRNKIGKIR